MSTERSKEVVMWRMEESLNQAQEAGIDEVVSPKVHSQEEGVSAEGRQGLKEMLGSFRTAFPDARLEVEHILAEGDKVMTWSNLMGRHIGPLEAVPAIGKKVQVSRM